MSYNSEYKYLSWPTAQNNGQNRGHVIHSHQGLLAKEVNAYPKSKEYIASFINNLECKLEQLHTLRIVWRRLTKMVMWWFGIYTYLYVY